MKWAFSRKLLILPQIRVCISSESYLPSQQALEFGRALGGCVCGVKTIAFLSSASLSLRRTKYVSRTKPAAQVRVVCSLL